METLNTKKQKLTPKDIEQIVKLLGGKCHPDTHTKLYLLLTALAPLIPDYKNLDAIVLDNGKWYATDRYQIREVRNLIINCFGYSDFFRHAEDAFADQMQKKFGDKLITLLGSPDN